MTNHDAAAAKLLYHGVLGNLVAVTGGDHLVRAQYGYGPYGEVLYAEGPDAGTFDRTYEDKARDAVSGLSYFGFRYDDLLTLGWTNAIRCTASCRTWPGTNRGAWASTPTF